MLTIFDRCRPVFPARAGMSLCDLLVDTLLVSFPRPRGDEPRA